MIKVPPENLASFVTESNCRKIYRDPNIIYNSNILIKQLLVKKNLRKRQVETNEISPRVMYIRQILFAHCDNGINLVRIAIHQLDFNILYYFLTLIIFNVRARGFISSNVALSLANLSPLRASGSLEILTSALHERE